MEPEFLQGLQDQHYTHHVAQEVLDYVGEELQPLIGIVAQQQTCQVSNLDAEDSHHYAEEFCASLEDYHANSAEWDH